MKNVFETHVGLASVARGGSSFTNGTHFTAEWSEAFVEEFIFPKNTTP